MLFAPFAMFGNFQTSLEFFLVFMRMIIDPLTSGAFQRD